MMKTLDEAWKWYHSIRVLSRHMSRLGTKYWGRPALAEMLRFDNVLREVEGPHIQDMVRRIEEDLSDFGVLLLFSVFEAIVREKLRVEVTSSLPALLHPLVQGAVEGLKDNLEHGSFGKITEGFKAIDADLVEEVNQVRRYRNWVAHGRSGSQPAFVDPQAAFDRLSRFLDQFTETNG